MFQLLESENLQKPLVQTLYVQTLSNATLFGSVQWLSMWSAIGATSLVFQNKTENAEERQSVYSALRIGGSLLSRAQAHIDGLPALIITPELIDSSAEVNPVSNELRDSALQALQQSCGLYCHWVDYFNQFSSDNLLSNWQVKPLQAMRIDITNGFPEFADSVKRHIKSGERGGAVVRVAKDREDARATFELAESTSARHSRNRSYPLEIYESLLELSKTDNRILWFVCEIEGKIIGAHIALHERDTIISWAPYMDRNAKEYKPAYLLMSKVISSACERGARFVNLGATPAGSDGVEQFKSRFGAVNFSYNIYIYRSLLARALGKGALS